MCIRDRFKADLKGSSEVPPTQTTGTGTVTVMFNPMTKQLTWNGTYSGLTGPATGAHFQGPAEPGKNAGIAVTITPATSPFKGSATLTDAQCVQLMAGRWYVNIYTCLLYTSPYPPLSEITYSPGVGVDYYLWALQISGVGTLLTGVNFVTCLLYTSRCV